MKARLIFVRNYTAQYSNDECVMEKECKLVEVELPITNNDTRYNSNIGYWQLIGYEEIMESK